LLLISHGEYGFLFSPPIAQLLIGLTGLILVYPFVRYCRDKKKPARILAAAG
jgi:TctA family transporter